MKSWKSKIVVIDGEYVIKVREHPHSPPILISPERIGMPYPNSLQEAMASFESYRKNAVLFAKKGVENVCNTSRTTEGCQD